ncbi:glycogen synthase kinase 3 [Trypanosoma equiperdum]|uniref:Glycogen synthase kinase 3 n=4 Tax=Trypanozoon TaxID=39700 RepID=GSK3B_TRYB2|nr:glycogen synthase kinase, putative [Trypanosoma brucei gambiense DAL972]XP_827861.1 protein kinase, putative [Trypanosoma brucei brucei TREU927]Q388M1.1 RecName: Full=Glycogen synthase kinase 3; Short=GSK-3 short [Trypanosoma brucei brucei TREU927]RHW69796.1 protein kinase [Trypanosoma brucei equiperdum]SCU69551.1 glycogen synthase kinase 3 [Trypanosoma equiperdum]EAN78749.1 protein kinase, putative [Trypanosoma brucei brucei TREU927]CBH16590.1 glycogen synthase kinase, putative [Trypanoso|eukprot:XP_011778854.1 glycogen synthase kinase, putative [Trypanosoma brucei gambiense DAL972]
MSLNLTDAADDRSYKEMEKYTVERVAGQGTFGTVQLARDKSTGSLVAIKKVIQDPRFKNRELQIMQHLARLRHPNIVMLKNYFYTVGGEGRRNDVYLNVVMEFVPETLHRTCRNYYRRMTNPPLILVKVFMFQLLRSIACLHIPVINICHRDIKPHNVLVDEQTGELKLCDFGSAKRLAADEPNVAYICSRYYRAPELIFGNQFYTTAVDIWSVGCIFAEMLLGEPIFCGENTSGQLREIVKILGKPTKEELHKLNGSSTEINANAKATPWENVFKQPLPAEVYDLCGKIFKYVPDQRITPLDALCHPFFNELREPTTKLPSGNPLPAHLYQFTPDEVEAMTEAQREYLLKK